MSIIAEFDIPTDAFALERTFDSVPDLQLEIERLATHSREWVMPFLWATGADSDTVETALREDPSVKELTTVEHSPDVDLYNVRWEEEVEELIDRIIDQHGVMIEAEAADDTWHLKLRFLDREFLDRFQSYFREHGHGFELQRIHDTTPPKEREYDLTPEQREVLLLALEKGYFSIPRGAQLADLGEELGISGNAVSERLRRATVNLARNTLTVSPPDGDSSAE